MISKVYQAQCFPLLNVDLLVKNTTKTNKRIVPLKEGELEAIAFIAVHLQHNW